VEAGIGEAEAEGEARRVTLPPQSPVAVPEVLGDPGSPGLEGRQMGGVGGHGEGQPA
jgi:hypothetical protein